MIPIQSERLVIRNFREDDTEALQGLIREYQASANAAYDHQWPTDPARIRGIVEWFAGGDDYLAVCLKEEDHFIGFLSLVSDRAEPSVQGNLGYVFYASQQGKGYATEACRALLAYAFEQKGLKRIVTGTAAANLRSCRLLGRLGFSESAHSIHSFMKDGHGQPVEFEGIEYRLEAGTWKGTQRRG